MTPSGKTKIWRVHPKDNAGASLGTVSWFAPWRKYVFSPRDAVFEWDCLRDIATFCEKQTKAHKGES